MAKIAVALDQALRHRAITGSSGGATTNVLARGNGWHAADVLCTSGPDDRSFEEQHSGVSIALVAAGTFQYRSANEHHLLTPGSFLLGNPGQAFECSHDHGAGDRCVLFHFDSDSFSAIVSSRPRFDTARLPPLRASAPLVARACAALAEPDAVSWEELAISVAAHAAGLASSVRATSDATPSNAVARVARAVRLIEHDPSAPLPLRDLARDAKLSPWHFLRTFTQITGATPHQYALRTRLRDAALRLTLGNARVTDVALDSGFGDLSNFNRTFRAEFGMTPRAYRKR